MKQLQGSEKQIAWATEIREIFVQNVEGLYKLLESYYNDKPKFLPEVANAMQKIEEFIETEDRSWVWIRFKALTSKNWLEMSKTKEELILETIYYAWNSGDNILNLTKFEFDVLKKVYLREF